MAIGDDSERLTSAKLHSIVNRLALPDKCTTLESEAFAGLTGGTVVVALMADAGSYAASWGVEDGIPVNENRHKW